MRRKFSSRQLVPIGEILDAALKRRGMAVKREETAVFKLWPQATGPQIALQTRPDGWRAGILFVRAASSVWVQQLHFMKEDIRQKLNSLAGKAVVRDIHFTVGHIAAAETGPGAASAGKTVLKERDKRMIAECTAACRSGTGGRRKTGDEAGNQPPPAIGGKASAVLHKEDFRYRPSPLMAARPVRGLHFRRSCVNRRESPIGEIRSWRTSIFGAS